MIDILGKLLCTFTQNHLFIVLLLFCYRLRSCLNVDMEIKTNLKVFPVINLKLELLCPSLNIHPPCEKEVCFSILIIKECLLWK